MLWSTVAYAQTAASAAAKPNMLEQFFPFILIAFIFYFLVMRPQAKKQKQQTEFLSKLKRGDSVLTSGGMFGTIEGLTDKFVVLEIAEDVRVRLLKSQIASTVDEDLK